MELKLRRLPQVRQGHLRLPPVQGSPKTRAAGPRTQGDLDEGLAPGALTAPTGHMNTVTHVEV